MAITVAYRSALTSPSTQHGVTVRPDLIFFRHLASVLTARGATAATDTSLINTDHYHWRLLFACTVWGGEGWAGGSGLGQLGGVRECVVFVHAKTGWHIITSRLTTAALGQHHIVTLFLTTVITLLPSPKTCGDCMVLVCLFLYTSEFQKVWFSVHKSEADNK